MTFGKRIPETERAKSKPASNEIPARYWVPVLGALAIGIGLVVFIRSLKMGVKIQTETLPVFHRRFRRPAERLLSVKRDGFRA
jgi:hypothetical protein